MVAMQKVRFKYPTLSNLLRLGRARSAGILKKPRSDGNVLVLHTGRSGSTLMGSMLDEHPRIFWDGEVIERYFHKLALVNRTSVGAQFGARELDDSRRHIAKRMRRLAAARTYGLELQLSQLEMLDASLRDFLEAAKRLGFCRFIVLDRPNHLRKIVSNMMATQLGRHHVKAGTRARKLRLRLNPKRCFIDHHFWTLAERLNSYEQFFKDARNLLSDSDVLHLDYEQDIADDPMKAYREICNFVDLPARRPRIKFSKTTNFPLHEILENYDEVAQALSGTKHAWMAPVRTDRRQVQ